MVRGAELKLSCEKYILNPHGNEFSLYMCAKCPTSFSNGKNVHSTLLHKNCAFSAHVFLTFSLHVNDIVTGQLRESAKFHTDSK